MNRLRKMAKYLEIGCGDGRWVGNTLEKILGGDERAFGSSNHWTQQALELALRREGPSEDFWGILLSEQGGVVPPDQPLNAVRVPIVDVSKKFDDVR